MKVKPTGLKGNDKIQRIQNLMDRLTPLNESTTNSSLEHVKYGPDGVTYGIVRENHTYFIKTTEKRDGKLISEDFEYIGGLQNKLDESYRSYEEALKHLNMKFRDLNESYGIRENIDLFRSDLLSEGKNKDIKKEQEEDTKYTLKVDSPEGESTETVDTTEVPTEPVGDEMSMDDTTSEVPTDDVETTEIPDEDGGEETEDEGGDLEKDIQRLTGKIGQKFREMDNPDQELEKYVINSILSAIDIDSMDDEFKEELIGKIEGEKEKEDKGEESEMEEPTEEPVEDETEETPSEEEGVKTESRIISKKTLIENLKSKKVLGKKLKGNVKESHRFFDEEDFEEKPSYGKHYRKITNPFLKDEDELDEREYRRKKYDLDEEEMLDEIEKMDVYDAAEFTANASNLKKGNYGIKDPKTGHIKSISVNEDEEENIYEIELDEDWMEEGNKFTDMLRKTRKGDTFKIDNKEYKDTSNYDELDEDYFYATETKPETERGTEVEERPKTDRPTIKPNQDEPYNPFKPKIKPQIQPKGRFER